MRIQTGAEAVDESHCAKVQGGLVHIRRTRAMSPQVLRNNAQEDAQHHVQHGLVPVHAYPGLAHLLAMRLVLWGVEPGVCPGAGAPAVAQVGPGAREVVPTPSCVRQHTRGLAPTEKCRRRVLT